MELKSSIKRGCGCLLGAILLLCIAGAIAEIVIVVDVDQRRFSSTAEGKVNRHLICNPLYAQYNLRCNSK